MPKFKVLRPIEHSLRLYVPEGESVPDQARSAANGAPIAVDASGSIELSEEEAAPLRLGQIRPSRERGQPPAAAGPAAPAKSKGAASKE
jgi:hypothetical protein